MTAELRDLLRGGVGHLGRGGREGLAVMPGGGGLGQHVEE